MMNEDEERFMLSLATMMAKNELEVWLCLGGAVFFATVSAWFGTHADLHQRVNWVPFFGSGFFAAFLGYLSVLSWQTAARARSLLAQLQAEQLRVVAQQPGIWPPPPAQ